MITGLVKTVKLARVLVDATKIVGNNDKIIGELVGRCNRIDGQDVGVRAADIVNPINERSVVRIPLVGERPAICVSRHRHRIGVL